MKDVPVCIYCNRPDDSSPRRELRPYGPDGAWVCAGCVFGENNGEPLNGDRVREAIRQMGRAIDASGDVAVIGDGSTGPRPATDEERKRLGIPGRGPVKH